MGCGASNVNAKVLPETTSVVPSASSTTSRPPEPKQEAPIEATSTTSAPPQEQVKAEAVPAPIIDPRPKKKSKSLVKACKDNDLTVIDELLKAGAPLEDLGMWDNTPLLAACTYGHAEATLRLITQKANVRARNEHGASPLHYAAVEGLQDVTLALMAAVRADGGDVEATKLVNCGHAKVYNRHLDGYAQRVPLSSAAESGFAEVAGLLLAAGATLEDPDEDGRTALWLAARHARLPATRLLLQHGADPGLKDAKGCSVLEAAMAGKNEEVILALLAQGIADVNDTTGSPLREAVRSGKRVVVEALLTHGASVELKPGSIGSVPLHAACEKGDEYLVSLLVRARADPSLSDAAGLTAFDLLRRRGLPDGQIVQLLSPPAAVGGADGSTGATGETADAAESAQEAVSA